MTHKESPVIAEELLKDYSIGDIVRYCADDSVKIKTGIILDIYNVVLEEREFPHANVYVMGQDERELVLLGNLTLLYKV